MVLWRPTRPSRTNTQKRCPFHYRESERKKESEVTQSCPTLCHPMDYSLLCSSVHGIFQARVLDWDAIFFSRGSSQPRGWTWVSHTVGRCFTIWATREVQYREMECKSRKSRNTWSNRQIWPWSTERSRAKANRVLPRERTGNSKHLLPTTQEKTLHTDFTRCSILKSDWLYSLRSKMDKLYTVSKNETGSWLAQIINSLLPNSDLNWRK